MRLLCPSYAATWLRKAESAVPTVLGRPGSSTTTGVARRRLKGTKRGLTPNRELRAVGTGISHGVVGVVTAILQFTPPVKRYLTRK